MHDNTEQKMMSASEIRTTFLEFFRQKRHQIVPSAPIVVKDDPTLMFTNAGMNQFKDYFLGNRQPEVRRVADTQKCLRVSGKHNDLEEVGIDTYHHTMFEMLGNWSFGDYFKEEAISWAWELLTDYYKLPKDKLYATVFEGDPAEGLEPDEEARAIWRRFLPDSQILNGNKKDNFWEMGDTGPCGPCSEIHIDVRPEEDIAALSGRDLVNAGHPEVIEIWNNVFIQYNRKADSSLEQLPARHVDTGMGFERLTRVIQKKRSNYDSDIFAPLISRMEQISGKKYGITEETDIAFRVIADHIRAITFTIADGQLPAATGAGYVIRRILRRALRYGNKYLGLTEPAIYKLVDVLADQFTGVFPEVLAQKDFIKRIVQEEENAFLRTLANGTRLFELHVSSKKDNTILSGDFVFELYDTYGFPLDLTQLMASERGLTVDEAGFSHNLAEQRKRSRGDAAKREGDWIIVKDSKERTQFLGYDMLAAEVHILRYREVEQKDVLSYHLVLDKTPFYPEGGGQVGDTGVLFSVNDAVHISHTFRENDLIIHVADALPELPEKAFQAQVDTEKRLLTENNHSATHLLHAALRQVLGTHVAQRGSLVNGEALRFDFSHFAKMTGEEIAEVERIVNERIRENIPLTEARSIPYKEAIESGAMALFGEKYGDQVRMITFDPRYSVELCGGTHVPNTGRLGLFKITSEQAIAAGVRRIEAMTASGALDYIDTRLKTLAALSDALKAPRDILAAVEKLRDENRELAKEIESARRQLAATQAERYLSAVETDSNGIPMLIANIPLDNIADFKTIAEVLRSRLPEGILLIGSGKGDKASVAMSVPPRVQTQYGLKAGEVIKSIAGLIGGGGGGQPGFAMAGGSKGGEVDKALAEGRKMIEERIKG